MFFGSEIQIEKNVQNRTYGLYICRLNATIHFNINRWPYNLLGFIAALNHLEMWGDNYHSI